jgi:hypothetical protein
MKYIQTIFKPIYTLVFASILFTACNMAKFDVVPGNRLANTPDNLIGTWGGKMASTKANVDTFTVTITATSIMVRTNYNYHELQIDKDYVLNSLGNFVVVGLNDPNYKTLKNMVILEESKNGWKIYPITETNIPFENRVDLEDFFEAKYFYSTNEAIELPAPVSNSEFDNQVNEKVRNHFYKMDEGRIESILNSRFRDKNYLVMSRPKLTSNNPTKPKTSKK